MSKHKLFLLKLVKETTPLPEDQMVVAYLKKTLANIKPKDIAITMDELLVNLSKIEGGRRLYTILINMENIMEIVGPAKFHRIYRAAIEENLNKVARFFTDLPPVKKGLSAYDKEEELKMEFITLGERRAMSKGNLKDTLDRLLSDPDTMVINNVLNNPRITEIEVLKITSKRPSAAKILELVAGHRKWSKRYNVIKSLVMNPYTPPRVASGLLEFLMSQDLKEIVSDKKLHPQVKQGALEILETKKAGV